MKKVNTKSLKEHPWESPGKKFQGAGLEISEALGRDRDSMDLEKRHPFDVEILRVKPGKKPYPYHSHSAQWEFYHVLSGSGKMRDEDGMHPIEEGDAFLYKPGEAHQMINDGAEDLVVYVIADNPVGEACFYPDSGKWFVPIPERGIVKGEKAGYYDGEED